MEPICERGMYFPNSITGPPFFFPFFGSFFIFFFLSLRRFSVPSLLYDLWSGKVIRSLSYESLHSPDSQRFTFTTLCRYEALWNERPKRPRQNPALNPMRSSCCHDVTSPYFYFLRRTCTGETFKKKCGVCVCVYVLGGEVGFKTYSHELAAEQRNRKRMDV